jgi:membrane-bound lytic murein transglycosylase D
MPESARSYGLRVSEGEVDERLDPVRSTDAAIHFLTDLHHDLGAWDLALAAYNMGPFGIFVRIKQVGGKAGFWDLAQASLLPEETAGYVPAIEAFALVLENLRSLHLGGAGKHPQTTAEITVKPGTRLSLIARAAHTSTLVVKELNRAYLGDAVPDGETTAWVPESEAHRAQIFFDSPPPDDRVDTCVPEDFDWGTTVLETSKYAQKCAPSP